MKNKEINCPNCRSNILDFDGICKYCGTRIINYTDILDSKFVYIKMQNNYLKCKCDCVSVSYSPDSYPVVDAEFYIIEATHKEDSNGN